MMRGLVFVATTCLIGVACGDDLVAPSGARIQLVANRTLLAVGGDTAVVSAAVFTEDGDPVDDNTVVIVTATLGDLCEARKPCEVVEAGAQTLKTAKGIVSAKFRTGPTPGQALITAQAGTAMATTNITLSALIAPLGSRMSISVTPDTIPAATGAATVTVVVTLEGNAAAPDGTRVFLSSQKGQVYPSVALTHAGVASADFTAPRDTATLHVVARSGAFADSSKVIVR